MEKKRMTKEQAIKMLKNRKVYVDNKSAEIQKKLFELGWCWYNDTNGIKEISYLDTPFLFIQDNMIITRSNRMPVFVNNCKTEISADEILSIEIVEGFKPFDKVLVRDDEDVAWHCDFFSTYAGSSYSCVGGIWNKCISYNGNEHLLGTTNSPANEN